MVLNDEDLRKLAHLVARLAPAGSTARLQADGHNAGNVFVGLIVAFEDERVPVSLHRQRHSSHMQGASRMDPRALPGIRTSLWA